MAQSEQHIYVQIKGKMSRDQVESINGPQAAESNQGKHLFIYNDKSGSMSGSPFKNLKEACLGITDKIFPDPQNSLFEKVMVCFYESDCKDYKFVTSAIEYENYISKSNVCGGTSFEACFQHIYKNLDNVKDGDKVFIMFFTDGQGSGDMVTLKNLMKTEKYA